MMSAKSMESAASLQLKISQLKETIGKVTSLKKALKLNAMEVKSEIQSSVSRQLEWLRSRELHLLQQVELNQAAKEELLSQQQDSLHQVLGGLHSSLDGESFASAQFDVVCDHCPCIRFQADVTSLHQSIREFGRVDTGLASVILSPLEAFPPSHLGAAASLPKPFEEYDDDEHHVLYKTVDSGANTSIQVNIPKLSPTSHDWLSVPTDPPAPSSPSAETRFIFPPFQKSEVGQQWLSNGAEGNVSSAGSLQQWLLDLQDQATLEEDNDFEILSPAAHKGMTSVSNSDIEVLSLSSFPKSQLDMDETVAEKALSGIEDSEDGTERAYFKNLTSDANHWLLQDKQPTPKSSCFNTCLHVQPVPMQSVDIENLDNLLCMAPVQYPVWKLTERKDEDLDVDEKEESIGDVCRANEVCSTFQDCVCDENCAGTMKSQEWLQAPKTEEQKEELLASPLHSYMTWMAEQQWLMEQQPVEVEDSPIFQYFQSLSLESNDKWLMTETQEEPHNPWWLCQQDTVVIETGEGDIENRGPVTSFTSTSFDDNSVNKCSDSNQWFKNSKSVDNSVEEDYMLCKDIMESWLLCSDKNKEIGVCFPESTVKYSSAHTLEKAVEMPEYADSESGKGIVIDHEELFLCFKKALLKTDMDGWLLPVM